MKKIIISLICAALILSMPVTSFAAFTQDGVKTKTAQVTVGGTASAEEFAVNLRNIATGSGTPPEITWTVNAGSADWKTANKYLEITGFATFSQWGIQIYTDNKNSAAAPRYTGSGNPAGLVKVGDRTVTLPMCWRVLAHSSIRPLTWPPATLDTSFQEKYIATGPSAGSTVILRDASDYTDDDTFFAPWAWMLDKNTPGKFAQASPVVSYDNYAAIVGYKGVHVGSGEHDLSYVAIPERAAKYCVLLGAKFTTAAAGVQYKTNRLVIEMYHL